MNWISVKDKLPKYSEMVLVCDKESVGTGYYDIDCWVCVENLRGNKKDITHWIELPEPPEAKQ